MKRKNLNNCVCKRLALLSKQKASASVTSGAATQGQAWGTPIRRLFRQLVECWMRCVYALLSVLVYSFFDDLVGMKKCF
jgi:hypothetical protein